MLGEGNGAKREQCALLRVAGENKPCDAARSRASPHQRDNSARHCSPPPSIVPPVDFSEIPSIYPQSLQPFAHHQPPAKPSEGIVLATPRTESSPYLLSTVRIVQHHPSRLPVICVMAVQTHRIHSIHGTLGPAFVVNSPLQSAQASSFNKLPNVSVASHDRAAQLSVQAKRSRDRAGRRPPRPASLPSLRQARAAPAVSEDPFADQPIIELVSPPPRTVPSSPSMSPIASRTRIPPPALAAPSVPILSTPEPQQIVQVETVVAPPGIQPVMLIPEFGYKEARGKLVAYLLLNRNCGRPRRRRFACLGVQTYVPSALSQTLTVEPCA